MSGVQVCMVEEELVDHHPVSQGPEKVPWHRVCSSSHYEQNAAILTRVEELWNLFFPVAWLQDHLSRVPREGGLAGETRGGGRREMVSAVGNAMSTFDHI